MCEVWREPGIGSGNLSSEIPEISRKTQTYFAIFSTPRHAPGKQSARAHSSDVPLRPCTSFVLICDKKRDTFGLANRLSKFAPSSQNDRVALFMEYRAFF